MKTNDNKILSHSVWNCKYHIVFAPKYRRKIFYESHRKEIMNIIKDLCQWKGIEIIEGEMAVDHVHLLLSIPPKMSVSGVMGYLKGKSSLMIFDEHANLKYNYGSRHFWSEGYYVSTVGLNKKTVANYIKNQELEDQLSDKRSLKEYKDPFTGK